MLVHTDQAHFCHFYNNGKLCPFNDIGCMFRHEHLDLCRARTCTRKLCPNKHEEIIVEDIIENVNTDSDYQDDDFQPKENQCHICRQQLLAKDKFIDHVKDEHFEGMFEGGAGISF